MLQTFEEELGSQIRRQRIIIDGSATREIFCEKHHEVIPGVTPNMLRSIEKADLFGDYELDHLILVISALWPSEACREVMGGKAVHVIGRKQEAYKSVQAKPEPPRVTDRFFPRSRPASQPTA